MKNFRNYFKREKRRILPLCLDIRPEGKDGR
jgi:acyl carrier protein phosphodiesterase